MRTCTRCHARLSIATPPSEHVCRPCARATRHQPPPPPIAAPSDACCAWCETPLPTTRNPNQRYCSMRCSTNARRIADMYRARERRQAAKQGATP